MAKSDKLNFQERRCRVHSGANPPFIRLCLMPQTKRSMPRLTGAGKLKTGRSLFSVSYDVRSIDGLRTGKGSISGSPLDMQSAFSAREGALTLEDGRSISLSVVAHTAETATIYFEIVRR
ncbi:MAG: hypothetical protein JO303_01210 [Caulobacteraceae bacterium]|nr:hypothetical protein [Caulobacteraceae bacterium]